MSEDSGRREEEIFAKARLIRSAEERDDFLSEACAGNEDLRIQVDELLSIYDRSQSFLESPPEGMEFTKSALCFIAALIPFGPFIVDRRLREHF